MPANAPVESKVKAGAVGAVGGAVASQLVLWVLGCALWGVEWDANHVDNAIAAVPAPLFGVVTLALPALASYWAGFRARHTFRPDLGETTPTITDGGDPYAG